MNRKVGEYNGKAVVIVNVWSRGFWRFSSNEFWKNIGCLISAPTFGIGGVEAVVEGRGAKDKCK